MNLHPFIECTAPQRSAEWFAARVGRLTASRAADMLAKVKDGTPASAARDLKVQLIVERITGQSGEDNGYVNAAMQRGIDLEPAAFAAYATLTGNLALPCGFCASPVHLIGCSPDGQIDDFAGILELKCPKSATHWNYLRANKIPAEYVPQITHSLWVTGAAYCDFLSFDDRFPKPWQTFSVRVARESLDIDGYAAKALAFLEDVEREVLSAKGWAALATA